MINEILESYIQENIQEIQLNELKVKFYNIKINEYKEKIKNLERELKIYNNYLAQDKLNSIYGNDKNDK